MEPKGDIFKIKKEKNKIKRIMREGGLKNLTLTGYAEGQRKAVNDLPDELV